MMLGEAAGSREHESSPHDIESEGLQYLKLNIMLERFMCIRKNRICICVIIVLLVCLCFFFFSYFSFLFLCFLVSSFFTCNIQLFLCKFLRYMRSYLGTVVPTYYLVSICYLHIQNRGAGSRMLWIALRIEITSPI